MCGRFPPDGPKSVSDHRITGFPPAEIFSRSSFFSLVCARAYSLPAIAQARRVVRIGGQGKHQSEKGTTLSRSAPPQYLVIESNSHEPILPERLAGEHQGCNRVAGSSATK